ncbi:hypothetical protein NL676_038370 [Syzygium grande]|nr:hypothetical protein NL676_038370 [Syzygium grande]
MRERLEQGVENPGRGIARPVRAEHRIKQLARKIDRAGRRRKSPNHRLRGLEFPVFRENVERDGVGLEGVGARALELHPVEELERQDMVLLDLEQDVRRPERGQPDAQLVELIPVDVDEVAVGDVDEVEVPPGGLGDCPVGHWNWVT